MGQYKIYRGFLPNGKEKIGCTKEYPRRCEKQEMYDYRIIEEHDCEFKASDREVELQLKHLGKRDNFVLYWQSLHQLLEAGGCTDKEKLSEMGKKGWVVSREKYPDMGERISKGIKEGEKVKGENNPACVLTEDKVRYIRKWCKPFVKGPYTQQRMAKAMGCSKSHISNVIARRIWEDLEDL